MKVKLVAVGAAALGAFVLSGPLQHIGVLPQTVIGDASKAAIKSVLNFGAAPAIAQCGPGGGNGGRVKGNNGWGNGPDSTNPGSFSGKTAGSKKDNHWEDGDGPRPGKFTTR